MRLPSVKALLLISVVFGYEMTGTIHVIIHFSGISIFCGFLSSQFIFTFLLLTRHYAGDQINLLKTKCYLLYISNQSVPRGKHFPPLL